MGMFKEQEIELEELYHSQIRIGFGYGVYATPEIKEFIERLCDSRVSIKKKRDLRNREYFSIKIKRFDSRL